MRTHTRQVNVRLTDEEYAKLDAMAQRTQRSRQGVMRLLLRMAVATGAADVQLDEGENDDERT